MSASEWEAKRSDYLINDSDHDYVQSLMQQVTEPGKFANWIAPPSRGINERPVDFKYTIFSDSPEYAERA